MSDTDTATPETPAAPAPVAPQQQETFSRDYVETLRAEAAKYRTEKKDAVEAGKAEVIKDYEGKLAEKDTAHAELKAQFDTASLELLKIKSVLAAGIPHEDVMEVVALVQGSDEAAVTESVERVKSLLGKSPAKDRLVDLSQGKGNHMPLNGDPILNMIKAAVKA
jgi:hypothetical protein